MSSTQIFEWYGYFQAGRTQLAEYKQSRTLIQKCIREDRRQTDRDISDKFGIEYGTCHPIITEELRMHRITIKSFLQLLTSD